MTTTITIHSREPYYWPREVTETDAEGNVVVVEPAVYAGQMLSVDIQSDGSSRSGQQVVEVAEDATDDECRAAVAALYGIAWPPAAPE
jgi:inosine-uridine nucleoside N-ribohydrolase